MPAMRLEHAPVAAPPPIRGMRYRLAAAAIALFLIASPAFAWNKATHEVVGAVAYDVLKQQSPQTIAAVLALLEQPAVR